MARPRDNEIYDIQRIMAILQPMPTSQRRRVLQYINDRVDLLPSFLPTKLAEGEEADLLETTRLGSRIGGGMASA